MKTSAGIYFRSPGRAFLPLLALLLISACATARYDGSTSRGYAVASWYGPGFHGKHTASGQRYDMYAMTCAHKTLPFGTRLRVTNPENGRSAEVVVNDRGPFVSGRDIDLSYAAAKKIGLVRDGTGRIAVERLGRDSGYRKYIRQGDPAGKGPFTIQVGSFRNPSNAEHLRQGLKLGYSNVRIVRARVNGERFYRVRVGKFKTRKQAYSYAKGLAEEGYSALIVQYQ
jgi:rare lipoprotein A